MQRFVSLDYLSPNGMAWHKLLGYSQIYSVKTPDCFHRVRNRQPFCMKACNHTLDRFILSDTSLLFLKYLLEALTHDRLFTLLRHGSNELDNSSPTARSSPVMLSAAKHLAAARDSPFAEFRLSEAKRSTYHYFAHTADLSALSVDVMMSALKSYSA